MLSTTERRKRRITRPLLLQLEDRNLLSTITVSNLADSGNGSLRAAITAANALSGADTIVFAPALSGTIHLTSGQLNITDDLTITGSGPTDIAVSADGLSRIFEVDNVNATISNLTLENAHTDSSGAALVVLGGTTNVNGVSFVNNVADQWGGAVADTNGAILNVTGSLFLNNKSAFGGGAITNWGRANVNFSTFVGNSTAAWGGAVEDASITTGMSLTGDTFISNTANWGGAVAKMSSTNLTASANTYIANSAHEVGGAYVQVAGTATISNSTLYANQAGTGGGIFTFTNLTLNNDDVLYNKAGVGGGIWAHPGVLTQVGGTVAFNTPNDIVLG